MLEKRIKTWHDGEEQDFCVSFNESLKLRNVENQDRSSEGSEGDARGVEKCKRPEEN